jgi:hypothetical protein
MPKLGLGLSLPAQPFKKSGDADAAAYIAAVEAADGQALEAPVKTAITTFIVNVKAQGGWDAIKSSCILSGARTLAGALTPLKGTAPTNVNFVSGDYSRRNGISAVNSFANPYIDTNRANNADPQNDKHLLVYITIPNPFPGGFMAGTSQFSGGESVIRVGTFNTDRLQVRLNSSAFINVDWYGGVGLAGVSRHASNLVSTYSNSFIQNVAVGSTSTTPTSTSIKLFNDTEGGQPPGDTISFYSIGTKIYSEAGGGDYTVFDAINDNLTILMTAFSTL